MAANIIETNAKYGVADANTIGQDELVERKQKIRMVSADNSTAEAKPTSVKDKVSAAAKNVTKEATAPAVKTADSADDFDNI